MKDALCSYRTPFTLFSNDELSHLKKHYIEILTEDLSFDNVIKMLKSLLRTEQIPKILTQYIGENLDGNPFYIEEVVNTLIDNEILIQKGNEWKIVKSLDEADIPSSINGVLTARLDKLEQRVKRIIQEAAVIGRKFLLIILKRITFELDNISDPIDELREADLIRLYQNQPDIEYIFKHAMTQEVAYKSLLKEERKYIHEKIGETIEQLFKNRLFEFYEVLSFHFKHGLSIYTSNRLAVSYKFTITQEMLLRLEIQEFPALKFGKNIRM